jgi:serine/threonine protein kinase
MSSRPFLAPEIIDRKLFKSLKTDVFSCGIILFLMLCGYHPFNQEEASILNNTLYTTFNNNPSGFWTAHINAKPKLLILRDKKF